MKNHPVTTLVIYCLFLVCVNCLLFGCASPRSNVPDAGAVAFKHWERR